MYSVLLPTALLLGIATTAFLRVIFPPAGVYLASSHPERISFFGQLSKRTIPGFAALLEVSNLADPNQKGFFGEGVGLLNDFRTTDPSNWPDVVKQLIEMAALVVADGRDRSPGVEFEVKRILRNRLEFKTAFLSTDGKLPSLLTRLNAKSSHPSGTFFVMTLSAQRRLSLSSLPCDRLSADVPIGGFFRAGVGSPRQPGLGRHSRIPDAGLTGGECRPDRTGQLFE
jgi:hypothetical protein